MKEKFLLKDELFNPGKVQMIATEIQAVYSAFDQKAFERDVLKSFPQLELKERIYHIRNMFALYLPEDYREAVGVLLQSLPGELNTHRSDNDFGDFIYAPYSEYVSAFGCNGEELSFSLQALREMTKRFSVEYAIRDFINKYPEETFEMLEVCSLSNNYHERRLASEGLRPKLPWAKKIDIKYNKALLILDNIFYDNTRYVTRSVSNHLNDISKIDPLLVIATLKRWKASEKQNSKEMDYIINHALRTLVKDGNEDALELLGYFPDPAIDINDFVLENRSVNIGEALHFHFDLKANEDCKLLIDYIIYFQTKSAKQSSKVYKIKKLSLEKDEFAKIEKRHLFKVNMSTKKLHIGEHKVELQINGKLYASDVFNLI